MTTWRPRLGALILFVLAAAACGATTVPPSRSAPAPPSAQPVTPVPLPSPEPDPTLEPPPGATLEPPPGATLVVGDRRLPGEVGSYVWAGGSDSAPWLPAAALERAVVPAGARAEVEIAGSLAVESWTATSAGADDPTAEQKAPRGADTGPPLFNLPADGEWVVAVHVIFASGLGDATWFWYVAAE